MNNALFGKTMENVRKHRNIELVTTEKRTNYLVSEPNYHTATETKKTQVLINKLVYLGLSISDLSRTVMYEFWYDYVKPKYCENAKFCYMDRENFAVHVKTDDINKDIVEDVKTRFDTSDYE